MPLIKRPLNAFGMQTLIKINSFGISQDKLAELMQIKPSNLSAAMRKENVNTDFYTKWTNRVDEALKKI